MQGQVVVLRALGLGDLCTGVPALRAVVRAFPSSRVVLAAPAASAPLVGLVHERLAHRVHPGLVPLPDDLRGAALAINLHGRGPESTALLEAAAPADLVAFGHVRPSTGVTVEWRPDEHERDRWCRLLRDHGIAADASDLRLRPPGEPSASPPGATVLHPGAAARARQWPVRRWVHVARALRARGHDLVVTGGERERAIAAAVASGAHLDPRSVLAGRTDLGGLAAIVASARLVVSADTGIAHLAFAYARPSVTLYGPVPPAVWGPPSSGPHAALWAGRTGDPHAHRRDAGLLEITVDDVVEACDRASARAGRRAPTSPRC